MDWNRKSLRVKRSRYERYGVDYVIFVDDEVFHDISKIQVERLQAMCPRPMVLKLWSVLESPRKPLEETEAALLK